MSAVRLRLVYLASFLFVASFLITCGGGSTPVTPPTTPAPGDTPTPTPTAVATGFPGTSCGLPNSGPSTTCQRADKGQWVAQVSDAVGQVQRQHPEIFNNLRIKDIGAFRVYTIAALEARGFCAVVDGDELAIKKDSNDFNEQYHVEVSTNGGSVRTGPDSYRSTCRPANFPINPTAIPPRGDCSLPSSREYACSRLDAPQFYDLVWSAIDQVKADKPELFADLHHLADIGKTKEFYEAIIPILRDQGFCAIFDGEELGIKNSNDFNEQYHLVLSSGQLYEGGGSYRSTCKPAAF